VAFFCFGFEDQKIAAFDSSYKSIEYIREGLVGCRAAFAGKPRSYSLIEYIREGLVGCQDAFAGKPCSYKIKNRSKAAYTAPLLTTH
jgi:hypothetical protein